MKTIVTYKQNEVDLFEYIESKRSKSSFIKDLIEREMKKEIAEGRYIATDFREKWRKK